MKPTFKTSRVSMIFLTSLNSKSRKLQINQCRNVSLWLELSTDSSSKSVLTKSMLCKRPKSRLLMKDLGRRNLKESDLGVDLMMLLMLAMLSIKMVIRSIMYC